MNETQAKLCAGLVMLLAEEVAQHEIIAIDCGPSGSRIQCQDHEALALFAPVSEWVINEPRNCDTYPYMTYAMLDKVQVLFITKQPYEAGSA